MVGKAFGDTMGTYFGADASPAVHSAALANDVALTYLHAPRGTGLTAAIPAEPALLLAVQLQPLHDHALWLDGRAEAVAPYAAGALSMLDLRTRPVAKLDSGYTCMQFYLPRAALDTLSDLEGTPALGDLPTLHGADDPVMAHLAHIARAAVDPTGPATSLFLESLFVAVHRHVQHRYAGHGAVAPAVPGGLAPWQEARAREYIEAHLDTKISLLELATTCQLSPSRFGRAFKASVGQTPHRWLITRRLARARELMLAADRTLADIAHACGFADQSHLAREFRRELGVGPSAWRRARGVRAAPAAQVAACPSSAGKIAASVATS